MDIAGIKPVNEITVDKLRPEKPGGIIRPLGEKEVYLERSVRSVLKLNPGDTLTVELPDGTQRKVRIADYVFDVSVPPYMFYRSVSTYTSPQTLEWLGGSENYNRVYFTVKENKMDEAHIRQVGEALGDK